MTEDKACLPPIKGNTFNITTKVQQHANSIQLYISKVVGEIPDVLPSSALPPSDALHSSEIKVEIKSRNKCCWGQNSFYQIVTRILGIQINIRLEKKKKRSYFPI